MRVHKSFSDAVRVWFIASVVLCSFAFMPYAGAAGQETAFRVIAWGDLLAGEYTGKTATAPANEAEMAAYLQKRENAPANPLLDGQNVAIAGFVVPLERTEDSALREFLLVPYFGACIHVPPPPQNQIIHVVLEPPARNVQSMDNVVVSGTLELQGSVTDMGNTAYTMKALKLVKNSPVPFWQTGLAVGLTLLCGISVCLGWIGPFARMRLTPTLSGLGTGFAAGVMACLGIVAIGGFTVQYTSFFAVGAAFMALVHWLAHAKNGHCDASHALPGQRGLGVPLAIAMHNIPECFIVLSTSLMDTRLGLVLAGAMIAHNLPLGISLGLASAGTVNARKGRVIKWFYAALAGLIPPVMAMVIFFYMRSLFSQETIRGIFACAGGALVFIALKELLPLACSFGKRPAVVASFAVGAVFFYTLLLFFYIV